MTEKHLIILYLYNFSLAAAGAVAMASMKISLDRGGRFRLFLRADSRESAELSPPLSASWWSETQNSSPNAWFGFLRYKKTLVICTNLRVSIIFTRFAVRATGPLLHSKNASFFDGCWLLSQQRVPLMLSPEHTTVTQNCRFTPPAFWESSFWVFCSSTSWCIALNSCKMFEVYSSWSKGWHQSEVRREQLKILKRDKTHHRFLNDANELLIDYTITCDGDVLTFSEHVKIWRVYVVQTLVPEHCRAHYSSCNCFLSGSSSEHKR